MCYLKSYAGDLSYERRALIVERLSLRAFTAEDAAALEALWDTASPPKPRAVLRYAAGRARAAGESAAGRPDISCGGRIHWDDAHDRAATSVIT
jgi:hypothetical protein